MRSRRPKGKTAPSRADDLQPGLQNSSSNVTLTAMSDSQLKHFNAALAAAAAIYNTAPPVGSLPQPKPCRQPRPRAEPHRMQSTMRKNPPQASLRPNKAEEHNLLSISENLLVRRARSNKPRALMLTPKSKAHQQLGINIPQPKEYVQISYEPKPVVHSSKTYTAAPMPILKRSKTHVLRDNLRQLKNDHSHGPAGDCGVAIQAVKRFIQRAKSKRIEKKRQKAEKACLGNKSVQQSSSITFTPQQIATDGVTQMPKPKLLGGTKGQLFEDRVAAMLSWHQQKAKSKRDVKRGAQNSKLKAKISSPFNFVQGVKGPSRILLEDDQEPLISKQDDVKLPFRKAMTVGLGIALEQTERAPLMDLPIRKESKAKSVVNEDIDNASVVTRFSDIIRLADEPVPPVPEPPMKGAAKGSIKDLKANQVEKGTSSTPVPLRKKSVLRNLFDTPKMPALKTLSKVPKARKKSRPLSKYACTELSFKCTGPSLISSRAPLIQTVEHIPALTNPFERADDSEDEVQSHASYETQMGYCGIRDLIQNDSLPSPSVYSMRGSRRPSIWGSLQIPQDEVDKLLGLPAFPEMVYELPKEKKVESYVPVRTWKGNANAKETRELMNMDKIGTIGNGGDSIKDCVRNTAFYGFYDDILTDEKGSWM